MNDYAIVFIGGVLVGAMFGVLLGSNIWREKE